MGSKSKSFKVKIVVVGKDGIVATQIVEIPNVRFSRSSHTSGGSEYEITLRQEPTP